MRYKSIIVLSLALAVAGGLAIYAWRATSVSRAVDELARRRLITRVEDPDDRRVRRLSVTEKGRRLAGEILAARLADLEAFAASLTPAQRRKLDAALSQLYAWCGANNVPIMAHTSHSFGPNADYEDRADPAFWGEVLEQRAFPRLRINMAHFGHFNNAVSYSRPASYVEKCWEWTVGKIITSSADGYAYADISSLGEILKVGASKKVLECMKAFKDRFPGSEERLLYGTD